MPASCAARSWDRMPFEYQKMAAARRSSPASSSGTLCEAAKTSSGRAWTSCPQQYLEEMEYKAANGIGTLAADEQHRLVFVGVPCYPIFRRFNELFTEWGGTFVNSTYLWLASGGTNRGFQYDLAKPIESLSEGLFEAQLKNRVDAFFEGLNSRKQQAAAKEVA